MTPYNPYTKKVQSYERIPEPGSPRRTEAWALIEAAKRLAQAITHGEDSDKATRELRKDALRLNWRLWTIFQAEVSREREDLPPDLRINMLTLCNFVDKHTVGALANPTAEALSVLIDLNRNIASGLLDSPSDSAPPAGQDRPPEPKAPEPGPPPGITKVETEA